MRDHLRNLERKLESLRGRFAPLFDPFPRWNRVERAVHLDGIELGHIVFEPLALRCLFRIEIAYPILVRPAARAEAQQMISGDHFVES